MTKKAFTMIELIVVISIIALLIGILAPGMNAAKNYAQDLNQKSQFHDIELALETYAVQNDNEYPDSNYEFGPGITQGAHKLAEALVGRDMHGLDPKTSWNSGTDDTTRADEVYLEDNYVNRAETLINLDKISAFDISQIYGYGTYRPSGNFAYSGRYKDDGTIYDSSRKQAVVFSDVYKNKKVTLPDGSTAKCGMPVLYYKANTSSKTLDYQKPEKSVFDVTDNFYIFFLEKNDDKSKKHPYYAEYNQCEQFYNDLINPKIIPISENEDPTPYNKESFLLLSAGRDGLYGTKDDIWNIPVKK